jgi:ribosomal protein S2
MNLVYFIQAKIGINTEMWNKKLRTFDVRSRNQVKVTQLTQYYSFFAMNFITAFSTLLLLFLIHE